MVIEPGIRPPDQVIEIRFGLRQFIHIDEIPAGRPHFFKLTPRVPVGLVCRFKILSLVKQLASLT